ncbi:unnamed protein product, partial [Rotaria magnacalcarata]
KPPFLKSTEQKPSSVASTATTPSSLTPTKKKAPSPQATNLPYEQPSKKSGMNEIYIFHSTNCFCMRVTT